MSAADTNTSPPPPGPAAPPHDVVLSSGKAQSQDLVIAVQQAVPPGTRPGQSEGLRVQQAERAVANTDSVHLPKQQAFTEGSVHLPKQQAFTEGSGRGAAPVGSAQLQYGSPKMVISLLVALLVVWCFGWLYIGTAWNPKVRIRHVDVAILNCDSGLTDAQKQQATASGNPSLAARAQGTIGAALLGRSVWNHSSTASRVFKWRNFTCEALRSQSPPPSSPGCPAALEPTCLAELQHSIRQGDFWAALVLPSNLSSNAFSTLGTNTSSQYRTVPLQYLKLTGRQMSTYSFIDAGVRSVHQGLSSALASSFASDPSLASRTNPFFYINPLPLQTLDLAPVLYFGQNFSAYLLILLTWISSIAVVATLYDYRLPVEMPYLYPALNPTRKDILRALFIRHFTAVACTLLSCTIQLLIVVFLGIGSSHGAQFVGHNFGYAVAFLWFASWSFLATNSLLINVLGPTKYSIFSTFLLVLQLATSGAIVGDVLSNQFFRLGYALPFTWAVTGMRAIFFGALTNKLWISWLVLAAWTVLTSAATSALWLATTKGRLASIREEERKAGEEEGGDVGRPLAQASIGIPLF